jgi:hypothetical protein
MTRTERLLRIARLREDRLAIAVLESGIVADERERDRQSRMRRVSGLTGETEAELRAAWGDR